MNLFRCSIVSRCIHVGVVLLALFANHSATAFPYLQRLSARMSEGPSESKCLQCHGNQPPIKPRGVSKTPPLLDPAFSMEWVMYEFEGEVPPPHGRIPAPHQANRGRTYYNWARRQMTEIYQDRCINIFPAGNDFSCQFLSVRDKTYFIQFELGKLNRPKSCCLWSKEPFWAPRPDVLANMKFQKSLMVDGKAVDFWMLDIPLPGPFGYGTVQNSSRPVAFWFPVIGAWVQQNFSHYTNQPPSASVFNVPAICQGQIDACGEE